MKNKTWLIAIGIILLIQIAILATGYIAPDVIQPPEKGFDKIGETESHTFQAFGKEFVMDPHMLMYSLFITVVWFFIALAASKNLSLVPGRLQAAMEMFVEAFDQLVKDSLGTNMKGFMPLIATIFAFVWTANIMGVVPGLEEPTKNLNVPVGLMLMVLVIIHITAIRVKGIGNYIKDYFEPIALLFPLNLVGEVAKGISLAFRLFGNILGGSIIIIIISGLVKFLILPPFLNMFFGLFVGTIQAFVFTMLSMTYLAVLIAE